MSGVLESMLLCCVTASLGLTHTTVKNFGKKRQLRYYCDHCKQGRLVYDTNEAGKNSKQAREARCRRKADAGQATRQRSRREKSMDLPPPPPNPREKTLLQHTSVYRDTTMGRYTICHAFMTGWVRRNITCPAMQVSTWVPVGRELRIQIIAAMFRKGQAQKKYTYNF